MRVAIISPTGLLKRYSTRTRYQLCLAHLILEEGSYFQFYKSSLERGHYVILDNSVIELGHPLSVDNLLKAIDMLRPSEFVLADFPRDPAKTHTWALNHGPYLKGRFPDMKLMIVPQWGQGRVFEDWWSSFLYVSRFDFVDTIGLPKFLRSDRSKAIRRIARLEELREGKEFHLLGTWGNPLEIRDLTRYDWIRGVDSKAPVRLGQYGITLHPELGLLGGNDLRKAVPPLQFSYSEDPLPSITDHNVGTFLSWALHVDQPRVMRFPTNTGGFVH